MIKAERIRGHRQNADITGSETEKNDRKELLVLSYESVNEFFTNH